MPFHQGLDYAFLKEFNTLLRHGIFRWGMDNAKLLFAGHGLEDTPDAAFIPDQNRINIARIRCLTRPFQHLSLVGIDDRYGHGGQAFDGVKHILKIGKFNAHCLSPCLTFINGPEPF
jgi:hypothetical protein